MMPKALYNMQRACLDEHCSELLGDDQSPFAVRTGPQPEGNN